MVKRQGDTSTIGTDDAARLGNRFQEDDGIRSHIVSDVIDGAVVQRSTS
jgi:hypothetical protein